MDNFEIDDWFVSDYALREVDWGPVGELVYRRTYSRDSEEWYETVERVANGCYTWQKRHCLDNGLPWNEEQAQHSAKQMYDLMFNFKFLPPGRGLFTMGVPGLLEKSGAAANNCGFTSTAECTRDLASPFCWAMEHLMLGVGVGFDTEGRGATIVRPDSKTRHVLSGPITYKVPDSRRGWSTALRCMLLSYQYGDGVVSFDYSKIRPKGAPVSFGGTASGYEPLEEMLESIRLVLDKVADGCGSLRSADIVDIMNLIGRCIVSGNIRRSAELALGDPYDVEFMQLKNKKKYPGENRNHRWAANHSVACEVGQDYGRVLEGFDGVDELGVVWLANARNFSRMGRRPDGRDSSAAGCNPCAEQTLEDKELCCLVEVFPSRHESYYELQKTLKYAYLYAKTTTLIPVEHPDTDRIIKRNRRIGCSMTGIQQAINRIGATEFYRWCGDGYKYLRSLDDRYSSWLNINKSIKMTSVKPSGTISKLPGVTSGIHFPPAEHYWQVIRLATDSPYTRSCIDAGYRCVDLSPGEPNTTAVYFPVSEKDFSRSESQVSMWEQALHAVNMQHYWADNQVSVTVKYPPILKPQIKYLLDMVQHNLKAISFFPTRHDDYEHAPWQETTKEVLDRYRAKLKPLDFSGGHESDDLFCSGDQCQIGAKDE
jgi:adenosylcobalamin-dependent ribonucleoside-triphosphate reductase